MSSSDSDKRPVMMVAVVALLIFATAILCFVRLPLALRLPIAMVDIIAALVLFAYSRQQSSK